MSMNRNKATLFYDGSHYRITIPVKIIRARGWEKGDSFTIDNNNAGIIIKKIKTQSLKSTIFSIGYEGKKINEFISLLHDAGISQLIDVRENPFSYKEGFSKTPLRDALSKAGIQYQHIKELGTERNSRHEYKQTGDIEKLCKTFSEHLDKNIDKYEMLVALANFKKSAIMCFENDFTMCHRQVLEKRLKVNGFEVVHICNGKQERF